MKLSVVVLCWNDSKVIDPCLHSIFDETEHLDYEVIVSDNGSTDGSLDLIRTKYPRVRIVENGENLGFARGNNAGIAEAQGEYILILNPDTIIHDRALEKLVRYADSHPEAGALGCRVLNPDGSLQISARPIPTLWRYLVSALWLRGLGRLSDVFSSDTYVGWQSDTEREVGFQSGCCVMFRGDLLKRLGGFDGQFFYHFEESDLCLRVWKSGHPVLFYPGAVITHLGGQSVGRFPVRFELEKYRGRYKFFYKHYGPTGAKRIRLITLINLRIRQLGYGLIRCFRSSKPLEDRLAMYRVVIRWNSELDPVRFVQTGEEPDVGYEPMAPASKMLDEAT